MKKKIIDNIIELEGGYVNDPSDSGGETNYGITKKIAVAYGYTCEMIDMPVEVAFDIYASMYWDVIKGDDIELLSEKVAYVRL
jgi:lysozyme family protein